MKGSGGQCVMICGTFWMLPSYVESWTVGRLWPHQVVLSLVRGTVSSGWMMCNVKEKSQSWQTATPVPGGQTTADTVKMLGLCVQVRMTRHVYQLNFPGHIAN